MSLSAASLFVFALASPECASCVSSASPQDHRVTRFAASGSFSRAPPTRLDRTGMDCLLRTARPSLRAARSVPRTMVGSTRLASAKPAAATSERASFPRCVGLSDSNAELERLAKTGWEVVDGSRLSKGLKFEGKSAFRRTWAFMTDVARKADELNHHPDWTNVRRRCFNALTRSSRTVKLCLSCRHTVNGRSRPSISSSRRRSTRRPSDGRSRPSCLRSASLCPRRALHCNTTTSPTPPWRCRGPGGPASGQLRRGIGSARLGPLLLLGQSVPVRSRGEAASGD